MSDPSSNAIEFADVTFRVSENRALLSDVNFSVRRGETLMLLGRSGSGKTTCLKMINRLYTPTAGEVRVDGIPVTQWDVIKLRRRIGYAIQDVGLFPHYSVRENVALVPKLEQWEPEQNRRPRGRGLGAGRTAGKGIRRSAIRINFPADNGSVSAWRAHLRPNRPSFSWTSLSERSIPSRAPSFRWNSRSSSKSWERPSSS